MDIDTEVHTQSGLRILGSIVEDPQPVNPLEEWGGGEIITAEREVCYHLGLAAVASRHSQAVPDYGLDGLDEALAGLIREKILERPDLGPWAVELIIDIGPDVFVDIADHVMGWRSDVEWSPDDLAKIRSLGHPEVLLEAAWDRLRAEGGVGTPYAVPVRYDADSRGATARVCDLLEANAVWVPDQWAIEAAEGDHGRLIKEVESLLAEFEAYTRGEVYAVKIQVVDPAGETVEEDALYGCIGYPHARATLEEMVQEYRGRYEV